MCRCATRAWRAATGSSPGAIRSVSLARAEGTRSRPASSTAGASIATTDSAGALQSREVSEPLPSSSTPSRTPASARNCASVRSSGSAVARPRPCDGHVPGVGVAGGEQPCQRRECVRCRSAVDAVVQRVTQRAHLHHDVDPTAQRGGQGGYADSPVRGVGEHQDVGVQSVAVLARAGSAASGTRSPPRRRRARRRRPRGPRRVRARPRSAPRSRPCRRPRRVRRADRRARAARTARCPTRRGLRRAGRRDGRTAAPWGHRERPAETRSPPGAHRPRS